jgi:hypothetical protein
MRFRAARVSKRYRWPIHATDRHLKTGSRVPTKTPTETQLPITRFRCKGCGSRNIRRTHRIGFKDRLLSLFGYYPYHCHKCQARTMFPAESAPSSTPPESPLYPAVQIRQERVKSEARRRQRLILLFIIGAFLFAAFAKIFILVVPASE